MYTLNPTDIDNGGAFFDKLNANFAEAANPQSSHTDLDCYNRFFAEMNKKAAELGMTNTIFNEPAGYQPQPAQQSYVVDYPYMMCTDANTMSAYDALKLMLYASQFPAIVSASLLSAFPATAGGTKPTSFTLTYKRNGVTYTEGITLGDGTVTQSADLRGSYDMLIYKGGTYGHDKKWYSAMIVARSKTTGKVYAVVDMNTTTGSTASDNKYNQCKKVLDYVDGGNAGAAPTFSQGGIVCIEMPHYSPTLWNRFDWAARTDGNSNQLVRFAYNKDFVGHPCSITKVMTLILLCENMPNLSTMVTVHEGDRQPPSGFNFLDGDIVRVSDLVKCMMVQSSNTSAMVVARVVGGILLDRDANVLE